MKRRGGATPDPALSRTSLIRELVHLSRFTESILTALGSAVVAVDGAGRITYVNPAAESLLGRPGTEILNLDADQVLRTRSGTLFEELPPGGGAIEVDLALPNDVSVTVDARLSVLEAEDNEGIVIILTDRTELKRAEQEARRNDRLASLGELSAGVAHEIRNPLAGIASSADLLRSRLGAADDRSGLADLILNEVARLDRIVESLLRFARPPEPVLRREDIARPVSRALALIQDDAARIGVAVETRFVEVPPIWIDPDQLEQVFLNLMRNALQAMEERGGTLRVTVRRVERASYQRVQKGRRSDDAARGPGESPPLRRWVEVEVTDSGHGIPPEQLDRVWNPFYTTRKTGTGLGLAITRAILKEHGGLVHLTSAPERGTSAFVHLPEEKRRGLRRRT